MGVVVERVDLRAGVWDAVEILRHHDAGQEVIKIGDDAIEVNWSPNAYYHHSLLLPLVLLTTAVDQGAAQARWSKVNLAAAIATAHGLDGSQKDILLALAGSRPPQEPDRYSWRSPWHWGTFAPELAAWTDRYGLAGSTLKIDDAVLKSGDRHAHYAVRPMVLMDKMPIALRRLDVLPAAATIVVLSLYDSGGARKVFKRTGRANLPVVDAVMMFRDDVAAYGNLLRMLAALRGW